MGSDPIVLSFPEDSVKVAAMPRPMSQIEHVVVLMLENRSFDNVLGWLYSDAGNRPPRNWPPPPSGEPTTFDGLLAGPDGLDRRYWNNTRSGTPIYAQRNPDSGFQAPKPGPEESFAHMTAQMFGPRWLDSNGD